MPEGDTVRRAARALEALVGERLSVTAVHPRARATGVAARLDGRLLEAVEARGKNLLLTFEGPVVLRSHLGMSGSWRVLPAAGDLDGAPWLVLRGARRQAVLRGGARLELSTAPIRGLGPDILDDPLAVDEIVASLRTGDPRREMGDALLDQRLVSGIGNIWRSEALWEAGISPWRRLEGLEDDELAAAVTAAGRLMRLSVAGSAPPRDVYRRGGRPCRRCGTPISAQRQGEHARTAYWCPGCQRPERGDAGPGA